MASGAPSSLLCLLSRPSQPLGTVSRAATAAAAAAATQRLAVASRLPPSPLSRRLPPAAPSSRRFAHSIPRPPQRRPPGATSPAAASSSSSSSSSQPAEPPQPELRAQQPSYELTFTCVPCGHRSAHTVSKQGYHHGSVLITCPSCRNRHVISDHLGIFGAGDRPVTVEDLMRERGRLVKKGTLGEDGDVEFWEDGTTTVRRERQATDPAPAPKGAPPVGGDGAAPGASWSKPAAAAGEGKAE